MTIRYRYNGGPKNTLATIREGNFIYFGIARYDDRYGLPFLKDTGRVISLGRAEKAKESLAPASGCDVTEWDGIIYSSSRLSGCCLLKDIKNLLEYFDNVDQLFPCEKVVHDAGVSVTARLANTFITNTERIRALAGL